MADIPEVGRLAAHTILDAVSAYELGVEEDANVDVMNLALAKLDEIGAVTATMSDDDGLSVDASNLVGGALVTINYLVHQLAQARGVAHEVVVAGAREFLDS